MNRGGSSKNDEIERDQSGMLTLFFGLPILGALLVTLLLNFLAYDVPFWLWFLDGCLILGAFIHYVFTQRLIGYVFKRLAEAVLVLWIIASLTFLLLRVLPGGPFDQEKALPPEIKANIEAKYKLNSPLYVQYFDYISDLLRGDLGESYKYLGRPISSILSESLPNSLQLGFYALIISFLVGIPLGVFAASRH
ncbi:MAG: ABC transporter permease, partial [Bdellovibrionales bacterium]|nr:ABC transporter permease [Bdellovibrionales bacterium]